MDHFTLDGDADEDDAAFLSAVAEAEADGRRRLSQEVGDLRRKHDRQHAEPAESVSSSLHSPYDARHGDAGHGFDEKEAASKRSRLEPEGDYMAALRGTHSETWQAMTSKARSDVKPRYGAASSASVNLGFDGGGAQGGGSGACFHCGKEGHWARDCPSKSFNPNPWAPDSSNLPSQSQVPERGCPCGGGVCKVLTANTEKNAGRQFYRCPLRKEEGQCGFFEWCDGNTSTSQGLPKEHSDSRTLLELSCPCGAGLCITLTAKTEKNMGRQFYRCPLNQGEGSCGFFKWCDENVPASSTAPAYGLSPYKERVPVSNNMPASNAASGQCYKCGMNGHWAKDCPSAAQSNTPKAFSGTMRSGQVGSGAMGTCYKCDQVGHWAKDCPNQQFSPGSKGAVGGFNRYGAEANVSRNYPNASGYGRSGIGTNMGASSGSAAPGACFKCGSQGHWSKDCPNARPSGSGGEPQGSVPGGFNRR
ncbi:hypothetical protein GOP47_0022668 [Adiantum capillus-veneris]|uniref:Uncharacterized protein n=1 Tax=Adiantum capillus-veneris TaxID=13818 RepID=A0A9D4U7S6_ADICA|nr:hypothetical protein GOP47_0022668 [Adiantum capillus-veneris]